MAQGTEGVHYLLVNDKIILRTTSKRIVEHYYEQMCSDDWEGERVITPDPSTSV
jgi:hypothetical protein